MAAVLAQRPAAPLLKRHGRVYYLAALVARRGFNIARDADPPD